jgi:hypothetical protein
MHRAINPIFLSSILIRTAKVDIPRLQLAKMTTSNGKSPSKRPSSTDLSCGTNKKPHNADKFSSTSAKQNIPDPSQDHKQSESVEGIDEWKKRPPYQIYTKDEEFHARHVASCHCGRVKYQLSREEPLDSKLCHCTTCQTQHGELAPLPHTQPRKEGRWLEMKLTRNSRTVPMGSHLPQNRYKLHPRPPRSRMVRPHHKINHPQTPLQSAMFLLSLPNYG